MRVISETGQQIGIMPVRRALQLARERGLDLVEVAPNANPPVCRILDYGKYKYEQDKQERESRKRHKQAEVKGVRLRPNISEHDIHFKIRKAIEFLMDGDKVKFTVIFRSREITRPQKGQELLERIAQASQEYGTVERPPTMEGRTMVMVLAPKKHVERYVARNDLTHGLGGSKDAQNQNEQVSSQTVQSVSDG